jgi:hypothetical protein
METVPQLFPATTNPIPQQPSVKNFWTDCDGIQSTDFKIYLSHFEVKKGEKVKDQTYERYE